MLSSLEISKDNLLHNYQSFRHIIHPSTRIVSVVKGNAYGHGQDQVVSILDAVTDWFAVDDLEELRRLRRISSKPTLVLGYIAPNDLEEAVALNASLVIYDVERLDVLERIGRKGLTPNIHLKIDAALGRQGILIHELENFIRHLKNSPHVKVEGAYAHFANIEDTRDFTHANKQIDIYHAALKICEANGYNDLLTHISSTAGTIVYEKAHGFHDLVRIGIGLYGISPSPDLPVSEDFALCPIMRWVTHLAQVKQVPKGYSIGYGLTYITSREMTIGIVPQGYSDGYDRGLSNQGEVLIHGTRCPVLGRVAMNMMVVDLSPLPHPRAGDDVVLVGHQGSEIITADEIAKKIDTIPYEVTTRISPLLPRVIV